MSTQHPAQRLVAALLAETPAHSVTARYTQPAFARDDEPSPGDNAGDPPALAAARRRLEALPLPAALAGAIASRRDEFLTGRACALAALEALGIPLDEAALARLYAYDAEARAPWFPEGTHGSVSHTRGLAWAVVARDDAGALAGLGVDVERVATRESTLRALEQHAVSPRERALLDEALGDATARSRTLLFSAKEALFKCLSPRARRYVGFDEAALRSLDPAAGALTLELTTAWAPSLPAGARFTARWSADEARVYTAVCAFEPDARAR